MSSQSRVEKARLSLDIPTERLPQLTLILLCGLPGTGKSHLAALLRERLPLVRVASDHIRRVLFPEPRYTPAEHCAVHATCQELVDQLLREGHSVVLDATNLAHRHRQRYYQLAEQHGAKLLILHTTAAPEVIRRRLQERGEGLLPAYDSAADWEIYQQYSEKMEPIRRPHRLVDTSGDLTPVVEDLVHYIQGSPGTLPPHPRARLIVNPAAGQGYHLADLDETFGYLVRQGWELSLRETQHPCEARDLARQAAEEGLDLVIAVGGDGTVNEVVNGLAGTPTAMAVLPMGSGNGWAREQGLPEEPDDAARALLQGQVRSVDLGLAGQRYFLLMASVGFDAAVVQALAEETKQAFWPLGYILKGITLAITFAGEETLITLDDRQVSGETILVVIGNTRLYGGVAQITPNASMDDGLLDVCVFQGKGGLPLLSLFTLGALLQRPNLISGVDLYRAREVTITSQTPLFVQTDGEPIGTTPMTFKAVPRSLRVLVPREVPPGLFTHP